MSRADPLNLNSQNDIPFILKTRRIEYTLEYFRQIARKRYSNRFGEEYVSVKDRADEQFIGELRFTTNRMFSVSTLIGANIASYVMLWYILF